MTDPRVPSPLWLAHHWPNDYDRCVRIGRFHVCRRCLVLYPVAVVVAIASSVAGYAPAWAPIALPALAVAEFALEHLGVLSHRPRRLMATSALAAVGLGVGFARYFDDYLDLAFWGSVIGWTLAGVAAALVGMSRRASGDQPALDDLSEGPIT